MNQAVDKPSNVEFFDEHPSPGDSRQDLLAGLQREQKTVSPKWFYDAHGSELFERITELPEYYLTRTEVGILSDNRHSISQHVGKHSVVIEPGSGSSEKIRLLLQALHPAAYVPIDISADFLREAAINLGREFPWLPVTAICADFNAGWSFLEHIPRGKRVVFYPGSTLGNLEPAGAAQFLRRVRELIGGDGGLLIGVDLHKDTSRLHAAYNDAAGITGEFNSNILKRLNEELDAEFETSNFRHHAFYNTDRQRIEMHLVSERQQVVRCNGNSIAFSEGESIHTENSYKYTVEGFADLAASAGLALLQSWYDKDRLFSVHYLEGSRTAS